MAIRSSPPLRALGDYLLLSIAFTTSRVLLYWAGLRFKLDLTWMFLADTAQLRSALAETVYTFHAFPPGMNVLTGWLLQISPDDIEGSACAFFVAAGLLLANSMLYLSRAVGLGRFSSLGLAMVFALLPQTLYFENLYLYTYPAAALLLFATALFHRGLGHPSFRVWFAFFLVCAVLGWLRSAFHLLWVLLMVGAVVLLACRRLRARALSAALVPLCILLSLYVKNWAKFGVFGATSWGGANLIAVTTARMTDAERRQWVREGKLSPFALISVFAPPRAYVPLLGNPESTEWPELSRLERPSSGAGNFNHWYYLVVNPVRRADARRYLRERPGDYLKTVLTESLVQVFEPSTEWHPFDDKASSPHFGHREALGRYEALYNGVVHRAFLAPAGLYALLPLVLVFNVWWALRRLLGKAAFTRDPRALLVLFACFQVVFVVAVSSLFTLGECARYRYLVEPSIWLLTAHSAMRGFRALRARLASGR